MRSQIPSCSSKNKQLGFFLNPFRFVAVVPPVVPPITVSPTTLVYAATAATATPNLVFTETK